MTKLAISVAPGVASGEALFEDIADIAESMDEFRAAPFPDIGLEVEGLPMFADFRALEPTGGFVVTTRLDAAFVSFVGVGTAFGLCHESLLETSQ